MAATVARIAEDYAAKKAALRASTSSGSTAERRSSRWGREASAAAQQVLGKTTPRIATPPLAEGEPGPCGCGCAHTPETTLGFAVAEFAERIRRPLDPWQRWLVIHALEWLPNGWPRFRQVLVLVARQNGKTELLVILSLFWLWVERVGLVLGTSTKLDYSRESWAKALNLAQASGDLAPAIADRSAVRRANGEQEITAKFEVGRTDDGDPLVVYSRYKIAAANAEGGRSLTVHRLIEDELRQHFDWSAHEAAENAMNAVDDAQAWAITNEGDDRSVVLHSLYSSGLEFIEDGTGDDRLGLFAWSAPDGCEVDDLDALAQANPNLGRRIAVESLLGKARRAKREGGEQEARFRVEVLCQRVASLDSGVIPTEDWHVTAADVMPAGRPVFFLSVADELASACIAVAALNGDVPHVELADARPGVRWVPERIEELATSYPDASFAASGASPLRKALIPKLESLGIELQLMGTGDIASACAHLARLVADKGFTHSDDDAVTASLAGARQRKLEGGAWIWDWKGSTSDLAPISAVTGALWLLETNPGGDQILW